MEFRSFCLCPELYRKALKAAFYRCFIQGFQVHTNQSDTDWNTGKEFFCSFVLFWLTLRVVYSTMAKKAWRHEPEATGHLASAARKQRGMNTCAYLTFSFLVRPGLQDA